MRKTPTFFASASLVIFFSTWWSSEVDAKVCSECKRSGRLAYDAGDYAKALQYFERVSVRQEPDVLVSIGSCQLQLGRVQEALASCMKYEESADRLDEGVLTAAKHCIAVARRRLAQSPPLARSQAVIAPERLPLRESPAAEPDVKSTIEASSGQPQIVAQQPSPSESAPSAEYLGRLTPPTTTFPPAVEFSSSSVVPSTNPYVPPPSYVSWDRPRRSRNTGLWSAGLTLWLSSYAAAIAIGTQGAVAVTTQSNFTPYPSRYYWMLALPLIGPFVSGTLLPAEDVRNRDFLLLNWTLPWVVGDGLAQVAGFVMLVTGASQRSRAARITAGLHVSARPGGGNASWGGEF